MNKSWQTPEYRKNVEEFLKLHPFCEFHGEPVKATVVHHPKKRGGYTEKEYISLVGCIGLCFKCHYAVKKKLRLCPVCKQHYFRPSKRKQKDRCWECFCKTPEGQPIVEYYKNNPKKHRNKKTY